MNPSHEEEAINLLTHAFNTTNQMSTVFAELNPHLKKDMEVTNF